MANYRKLGMFAAPLLMVAAGAAATGCSEDSGVPGLGAGGGGGLLGDLAEACGPCGDVELGVVDISGNAEIDGFFAAVSQLNSSVVTLSGEFEASLAELEAVWGIEAEGDLNARVGELVTAIEADFGAEASAQASLDVVASPGKCSANVDVAVDAQAKCEARADCEVDVEAPSASVTCEGSCTGTCEGSCEASAEASCAIEGPSIECSGTCEGTCELEVAAACEGTCNGTCNGECSFVDGNGDCAGECDGTCEGSCEASAGASCEGTCTGTCVADAGGAECSADAELRCEGKCEGSCEAGCEGEATPGSASADCEASADCQAQASAQASASMECTPPSIDIVASFDADVSASARAELTGKIEALRVHGGVMFASFIQYKALIDGEVNGEAVFDTPPVQLVIDQVGVVASAAASGELDLPIGRLPCAVDAFAQAGPLLTGLVSEASGTLEAQASFVTAFSAGFQG